MQQLIIQNGRVVGILNQTHFFDGDLPPDLTVHEGDGEIGWVLTGDGTVAPPLLRRFCVVNAGVVTDVFMAASPDVLILSATDEAVADDEAGPGWTWSKKTGFVAPEISTIAPVPQSVTLAQARVALRRAGLFEQVDAAIHAAGGEALDAWEYSNTVARQGALVMALGSQIGLTGRQIDDLFTTAAAIEF